MSGVVEELTIDGVETSIGVKRRHVLVVDRVEEKRVETFQVNELFLLLADGVFVGEML